MLCISQYLLFHRRSLDLINKADSQRKRSQLFKKAKEILEKERNDFKNMLMKRYNK